MRISAKCSSAVHVLMMIAMLPEHCKVTSEFLASSVGIHAVEVRKLLSSLKKAGIIDVVRGPGGATLKKDPKDITLLDIYGAVDSTSIDELIGVHSNPAQECPFGKNIGDVLAQPYAEISDAVREKMEDITLEQLIARLQKVEPTIYEQLCTGEME